MGAENPSRFGWRIPLVSAFVACPAAFWVVVYGDRIGSLLYAVGVAFVGIFALLIALTLSRSGNHRIAAVTIFLSFAVVTAVVLYYGQRVRTPLCWMLWSKRYKNEVLAQTDAKNGEFKHVEWDGDGWGGAPVGDWMGYIVFDPNNSLRPFHDAAAHRRFAGIPCNVVAVRRLENRWYSVVLDMNEFWGRCGSAVTS